MSYIILCLVAGNLVIQPTFNCQDDAKKKCWEVGQRVVMSTPAILCGEMTPAGVFIPKPCPSPAPAFYVEKLSCPAAPAEGGRSR